LGDGLVVGTLKGTLFRLSETLSLVWSLSLGSRIYATPFVAENGNIYIGTTEGNFYCISQDGQIQWKRSFGSGIVSSAVADDGNVYFGLWDGRVVCLSHEGDTKWYFETGYLIYSAPALDYLGNVIVGSADGCVYHLDSNGALNWRYETGDAIYAAPSIDTSNNIYIGSYDSSFYSLSQAGILRWRIETENQIHATAGIAANGNIYFASTDRKLYAVTDKGEVLWNDQAGVLGSPIIDSAGYLFIDRWSDNIDKVTPEGDILVGFGVDRGDDLWGAQPVISESGLLYYVSVGGVVFCMGDDSVEARLTSSVEIGKSLHGLQEIENALVALDWKDGSLYKINLETWEPTIIRTLPHILMDIAVERDTLYAGMDRDGMAILAYDLISGQSAAPIPLGESLSFNNNELWGLEKSGNMLYLMGRRADGQVIVAYDLVQQRIVSEGDVPPVAGELLGLQQISGRLFTFSWGREMIYEVILSEEPIVLREVTRVEFLVPQEDIAPGGFRGFYLGKDMLYLTSVASGVYSRVHVAPYPDDFWDD
jgi:outer membrane protein assembly factor BamB